MYSVRDIFKKLLLLAKPIKSYIIISSLASIIGNLSRMLFMVFGSLWILSYFDYVSGSYWVYTLICGILIAVCRYLEGVYSHLGAYGLLADLRVKMFDKLCVIAPRYLIDHNVGDILASCLGDIETLEHFFAHTIGPMFTVILLPLISVIIAWHYSYLYGLILIPIFILVSIIIPLIALVLGRRYGRDYRKALGDLKKKVYEDIFGIKDIKIFNDKERVLDEVIKQNEVVNKANHGLVRHKQIMASLPNLFILLVRILVLYVTYVLYIRNEMTIDGAVVVSCMVVSSFSSTFSLTKVVTNLLEAFAAGERIFKIFDEEVVIKDGNIDRLDKIQSIDFKDVSFKYPNGSYLLENCNLRINKGESIGIVGESGIGKSTILRLLTRFYDVSKGEVLLNDNNIKDLKLRELHNHIGLLEQDTYLFDTSIKENIRIAKLDASDEEIIDACKKAGIHDFIMTLPNGYDTQMGQMSSRVSGGEKQRIGIARLFLRKVEVLVMDEPTSSLDAIHEKEIMDTLDKNKRDNIHIIISHRMSTLIHCDRIYHLENHQLKK